MNPEGIGLQPMIATVDLSFKMVGGHSMRGPLAKLQNAVSFNYYANSTYYNKGIYATATRVQDEQVSANERLQDEDKFGLVQGRGDFAKDKNGNLLKDKNGNNILETDEQIINRLKKQ